MLVPVPGAAGWLVLGAVNWLRAWWRHGAGAVSWQCAWWRLCDRVPGCWVLVLAAVSRRAGAPSEGYNKPMLAAVKGDQAPLLTMKCQQSWATRTYARNVILSLERSLSISAVGYLHSSGSVLADSCVKGRTVCAHTFVRIMFYAQRQALNRPLLQHVSACYTHKGRAGYCLALGE